MNFGKLPVPHKPMSEVEYKKWQENRQRTERMKTSLMRPDELIKEAHTGGMKDYFAKSLGQNIAETLIDCGLLRTCLNCDHWNGQAETCAINNNMRPPAKVIVVGCKAHTDIIPF